MNIVDRAQETESLYLAAALAEIHGAARVLLANGRCHNCQAAIADPLRFCDSDCRDDYANRQRSEILRNKPRPPRF
jgi:hypothetical protein